MNAITEGKIMEDKIEKFGASVLQHGKSNNRIYLLKLNPEDTCNITGYLDQLAKEEKYTKIFARIRVEDFSEFLKNGYCAEAFVPRFYNGKTDCVMASKFFSEERKKPPEGLLNAFNRLLGESGKSSRKNLLPHYKVKKLTENDIFCIAGVFKEVFETYPFPVYDPVYILNTMQSNSAQYFGVLEGEKLVGISTAEADFDENNAEMTDFAVLPECRGQQLAWHLLVFMEQEMRMSGIKTAYTIARLAEPGMNRTFINAGYQYSGTLVNNTNISGSIESMNIFYKLL